MYKNKKIIIINPNNVFFGSIGKLCSQEQEGRVLVKLPEAPLPLAFEVTSLKHLDAFLTLVSKCWAYKIVPKI